MRKVTFLELVKLGGVAHQAGDVRQFDDETAALVIANGWAEDAQTGERGERSTAPKVVRPDAVKQTAGAKGV